jgi:hypothetical protein
MPIVDSDLLRIIRGMLSSVLVPPEPFRVDTQHDISGLPEEARKDIRGEEDVGVSADEALIHQVFPMQQGRQDIILLPGGVVAEGEPRVILFHPVNLVTSDETNVIDPCCPESKKRPIQEPPMLYFGVAFWSIGRGRHEPASPAGSDQYGSHESSAEVKQSVAPESTNGGPFACSGDTKCPRLRG